jgi:hypothetical protein
MSAKTKLRTFLKGLAAEEKNELWAWLDGDPRAAAEMITWVGRPSGHDWKPRRNLLKKYASKVPAGEESLPGSPFSAP